MNNINELSIPIAERVKSALGSELLKIDSEVLLRSIILDAAGHVIGAFLDQMRNDTKAIFDQRGTPKLQQTMKDVSQKLIEEALDESTISQAINILRAEQQKLKKDTYGKSNRIHHNPQHPQSTLPNDHR